MSLYADYITERTDDKIIETDDGFCTYRFLNASQVYIIDIYVVPKKRKFGVASTLANLVCEIAKKRGCVEMVGTVVPSTRNSTDSLKVLIAYGMKLLSSSQDLIIMSKEI